MKKFLSMLALALMTVVMAFTVAGCGNTSSAVTNEDLDALIERVEELEQKNENLNVFWTDKAEYSEDEVMIVYFKNSPVFTIRLSFSNILGETTPALWKVNDDITGGILVKSLCSDIMSSSIISTTYLMYNYGSLNRNSPSIDSILKKDIETRIGGSYDAKTISDLSSITWFDIVICVPGTPFELARFKNVSFNLS